MKRFILLLLTFVIASNTMDAKLTDLLPRAKFVKKLNAKGFRLSRAIQIADSSNTLVLKDFFTEHGCTIKQNARAKVVVNLTDRIEDTEDYYLAGYENEAYRLTRGIQADHSPQHHRNKGGVACRCHPCDANSRDVGRGLWLHAMSRGG